MIFTIICLVFIWGFYWLICSFERSALSTANAAFGDYIKSRAAKRHIKPLLLTKK